MVSDKFVAEYELWDWFHIMKLSTHNSFYNLYELKFNLYKIIFYMFPILNIISLRDFLSSILRVITRDTEKDDIKRIVSVELCVLHLQ